MTDLAAVRFDLISPLLRRYKRRFTLLDLGAGINPYMAQRISREFDAVVVAVEQDEIIPEELAKFGPRALWLRKKMSAEELRRLGECEHFDVVLGLNILHHFGHQWQLAIAEMIKMGSMVIIQTPDIADTETCGQGFTQEIHEWMRQQGPFVGESVQFEGHMARPIYDLPGWKLPWLTRKMWTDPDGEVYVNITSDYETKTIELEHKKTPPKPFIHGLNLWNFAQLNGQWPRKEAVLKMIREFPLPAEHHGDITPHNFLFDGAELHLIDGHEGWEFDDRENLLKAERMMEGVLQ